VESGKWKWKSGKVEKWKSGKLESGQQICGTERLMRLLGGSGWTADRQERTGMVWSGLVWYGMVGVRRNESAVLCTVESFIVFVLTESSNHRIIEPSGT